MSRGGSGGKLSQDRARKNVTDYLQKHGPSRIVELPATNTTLLKMTEEGLVVRQMDGRSFVYSLPSTNGKSAETPIPRPTSFRRQVDQQTKIAQAAEMLFGKISDWSAFLHWYELTKELMDRD